MIATGAQHIHTALDRFLASEDALLVGESVGRGGGHGGSTAGLLQAHPNRVLDTPVGDRSVVGLGLGLALGGKHVVVELSSTRSLLAASGVLTDAARAAGSEFRPALTIRVPYQQGLGAEIEPAVGDLLCHLPGIGVHVGRAETFAGLLEATLGKGVHVILETAEELERRAEAVPVTLGAAHTLRTGSHVTLVAWGTGVRAACDAADALATSGIQADVLDPVTLSSLCPSLGERVRQTGRVVAVGPDGSSFTDRILASALQSAFLYLESPPSGCRADVAAVVKAAQQSVHY